MRVAVSALIFFSEPGRAVVRDSGSGQLWWCVGIVGNFLGHCGQLWWVLWKNWNHGWQTWQAAYLCSQWWGGGIHFFIFPKISFPFPEEKSWLMRNPRARGRRGGGSVGGVSRGGSPPVGQSQVLKIRDGILQMFLWIMSKLPPPSPNLDNLYNFFRRQNSRSGIQFRTKILYIRYIYTS